MIATQVKGWLAKRWSSRFLLPAAIGTRDTVSAFQGSMGGLSSLSRDPLFQKEYGSVLQLTPTLSLTTLLRAIPDSIAVEGMITDLQGFDLAVVSSVDPALLARVGIVVLVCSRLLAEEEIFLSSSMNHACVVSPQLRALPVSKCV